MTLDLTSVRTAVSQRLDDANRLIWSDVMLDAAVRDSLGAIGRALGDRLTLSGLDEAEETTLPADHQQLLVVGAVAYALTFRVSGRFEDAGARDTPPAALADWAEAQMAHFLALLRQTKRDAHQQAGSAPYGEWEWEDAG
ncbi:hypothetical protein KQH62_04775 [bacterium]|nr:hypothetical protein [bacterium]